MSSLRSSTAFVWALIGIFASVDLVLTIFPYTITVGTSGHISLGMFAAPVIGFLLGPIYGVIAVVIGSIIGFIVNPAGAVLGPLTLIPPALSAFLAGALRTKRTYLPPIFLALGIMGFLTSPVGREVPLYVWMHTLALVIAFTLYIPQLAQGLNTEATQRTGGQTIVTIYALFATSMVAIMADHIIGSFIGAYYLNVVSGLSIYLLTDIFTALVWIYPIERIIAIVVTTVILFALDTILPKAGIILPTSPEFGKKTQELEETPVGDTSS